MCLRKSSASVELKPSNMSSCWVLFMSDMVDAFFTRALIIAILFLQCQSTVSRVKENYILVHGCQV